MSQRSLDVLLLLLLLFLFLASDVKCVDKLMFVWLVCYANVLVTLLSAVGQQEIIQPIT